MPARSSPACGTANAWTTTATTRGTNAPKLYTLPDERVPLFVAGNGPRTTHLAGR